MHLAQYFAPIGQVSAVRVAGDMSAPTRMAWVEFMTRETAQLALAYDGQARTHLCSVLYLNPRLGRCLARAVPSPSLTADDDNLQPILCPPVRAAHRHEPYQSFRLQV